MKHSASMFHFWFQCFIFYLPHPFPKNTHGEKSNPNGSDLKPQWERNQTPMGETPLKHWNQKWNIECQCFISWKHWLSMHCVMKMKHGPKKRLKVNIMYARVRQRVLTWGRRVPAAAFACQGSMPWQANTIHFLIAKLGHRTPTWQCRRGDASPPSEDASPQVRTLPQRTYIYTREITPSMFFNTKHKKIVPIICSFKAEEVLLPCYSFPAKKSLKKVSFFKSLVYNVLRI